MTLVRHNIDTHIWMHLVEVRKTFCAVCVIGGGSETRRPGRWDTGTDPCGKIRRTWSSHHTVSICVAFLAHGTSDTAKNVEVLEAVEGHSSRNSDSFRATPATTKTTKPTDSWTPSFFARPFDRRTSQWVINTPHQDLLVHFVVVAHWD